MDNPSIQAKDSSQTLPLVPCQPNQTPKEHSPSNNLTSPSKKTSSPLSKEASRFHQILEALAKDQKHGNKGIDVGLGEIDSYITELLEKIQGEKRKIAERETTRASHSSEAGKDALKSSSSEQENLWPKDSEKDSHDKERANEALVVENEKGDTLRDSEKEKKGSLRNMDYSNLSQYSVNDLLQVSKRKIDYGINLPGRIVEESLDIINKSNEEVVVQVFVDCFNPELQDTDEYVYSVRRSHAYDYNDKHYMLMSPHSQASFKLALKVPNMKIVNEISGEIKISVKGAKGVYKIRLTSLVKIPKVICPKELYNKEYQCKVIKLVIKQGKKLECKFPLKNKSDMPVCLELSFYQPKNMIEEDSQFQCLLHPNTITIPSQGLAMVNIVFKRVQGGGDTEMKTFKKVLIGSVKNSALIYSFLLWFDIC